MKNYICEKYNEMTLDEIIKVFKKYETKTEMFKKDSKFYNHCRLCGWLKYFPKKENTYTRENDRVDKYNIEDIDLDKLILIPSFKEYYIDIDNCIIYKKLKKRINKVVPYVKKNGLICYSLTKINGDKKTYPYHKFLRIALGLDEYNCVSYNDGDFSNIKRDNLFFYKYDVNECRQIHTYYNDIINRQGEIYNIVDEIVVKGDKIEGGRWKFGI